jgi:probable HAF family extracellular repeat protein
MSRQVFPRFGVLLLALLCVVAGMAQAAPAKKWTIVDLGSLGTFGSRAQVVNNRGDVAGETSVAMPGGGFEPTRPFLWQDGVMRDLGSPSGAFAFVWGMNDRGSILANDEFGNSFLWKDGTWNALPLGSGTGLNKSEAVAGIHAPAGAGGPRAYLYSGGVFHDLGTLGGTGSAAWGLNDRGAVVGDSHLPGDESAHAFLYEDGVMKDLGTLGGAFSGANDVNNHGVVVGSSALADGRTGAFIYDAKGGMRPLFATTGLSDATAINDHGAVVGNFFNGKSFLFEDGILTRLEEIPEVVAAGWTSLAPADINDRGWIVGQGVRAGQGRAFLLTPR